MESGYRLLTTQDITTLATAQQEQYGAKGATPDGRTYVYVGYGGTSTIAPGKLCVAAPIVAAYQGLAITAVGTGNQVATNLVAGSRTIILTNGATTIATNQFADGYLEVLQTSGTNNGPILYRISGNTAAAASATFQVNLLQEEPLRNASTLVAGTDVVNIQASIYSATAPSATAAVVIGVTPIQVPNTAAVTNWGWVQQTGEALLTNDAGGTLAVGVGFAQSTTTAGSIVAVGATTVDIGQTRAAITASATGSVKLTIV